jgi:alkaline phosphatase D
MSRRDILSRRTFLHYSAAAAPAVLLGTGLVAGTEAVASARIRLDPFTLGVASGDPKHSSVVLWTRLAPEPFEPDGTGGMSKRAAPVQLEVAADEHFRRVVHRGTATATAALGHSVHAEVTGLAADRHYWYRFRTGTHLSPVGRTRTTPHPGTAARHLRFAFASCQAWHDGYFTAFDHLADEDLDLVVHLGDYIYERGLKENKRKVNLPSAFDDEAFDLEQYRLRYALYKSEDPLQRAHASFPWIHTIDDHEVENNWAGNDSEADHEPDQDPAVFRRRRAAAFQAMYENLPLRHAQLPAGPEVRLHRRLPYGTLASFTMLDTRQYRSDQPCGDGKSATCTARFSPRQTMLGGAQKKWLLKGFSSSTARWQVLGNQAPMGQTDLDRKKSRTKVYLDPWDGYVAERNEVLRQAHVRGVRNLMVITGDRHQNYAQELKQDYQEPSSRVVGAEFVGTSIASEGDGADLSKEGRRLLAANPHLKFFNEQRGYVRVDVTPKRWQCDFRVIPYVHEPGARIRTRASFVVQDQSPTLHRA